MSDSKDLYDKFVGSLGQGPLVKPDAFFFGTITQVRPNPLVLLDGDSSALGTKPILLARDAVVGSRVLCQLHGRQLIVVLVVRNSANDTDELGATEHLDDLIDTHTWHQGGNADTSTSRGYPIALAGLLEVFRGQYNFCYQRYTTYNGSGVFWRVKYNSTWSAWQGTGPGYAIQFGTATVNTGVVAALGFGSAPLSPGYGYTRATNRVTVPVAGIYNVSYRFKFNSNVGTGRSFVEVTLASATSLQYGLAGESGFLARVPVGISEDSGICTATSVALLAGAQIGGNAYQTSGAVRSIDGVLNIQQTG